MEFFNCQYYRYNRILLSLIGQWPYENWKTSLPRTCLISLCLATGFVAVVLKFGTLTYTMDAFAELVQTTIYMMVFIVNYSIPCLNNKNMKTLLEHIKCDWSFLETAEEYGIIRKYANVGRIYSLLLIASFSIASPCFLLAANRAYILDIVAPLNVSRAQIHPFPCELFVDPQTYYTPILMYMMFVIVVGLIVTLSGFIAHVTYIQHACGMYSVVGYQLEVAFRVSGQEGLGSHVAHFHGRVARGVEFHKRATCFNQILTVCYAPSALALILFLIVLLSINLYRVVYIYTTDGDKENLLMCILGTYGALICFFFGCYTGQQLLDHGDSVSFKAYSSEWFLAPPATQKLLVLVMMRSNRSCGIGITRSVVTSFALFAATLQTSMSYFMALWSLQ